MNRRLRRATAAKSKNQPKSPALLEVLQQLGPLTELAGMADELAPKLDALQEVTDRLQEAGKMLSELERQREAFFLTLAELTDRPMGQVQSVWQGHFDRLGEENA